MNYLPLLILITAFISTMQSQMPTIPNVTVAFNEAGKIYVTNFKDTPIQLTDETTFNTLPVWSADGQQLAFLSEPSPYETGNYHLAVMNVATRSIKQISSLELTTETQLVWSPDSKHLAVTLGALFIVDLETGATRQLSVDHISAQNPSWSPDSNQIAFAAGGAIYAIYTDGHDIKTIAPATNNGYNHQSIWSPLENKILFIANKDDEVSINAFNLDTQTVIELLTTRHNTVLNLQWSPDASKIAFTVLGDLNSDLSVTDSSDIYSMDADGRNLHALSNKGVDNLTGWVTDNKFVLYQSGEPGGANVSIFMSDSEDDMITKLSDSTLEQICSYGNCQNMSIRPEAKTR